MITCDRCKLDKADAEINRGLMVSSGCYDLSGPPWDRNRRNGELVICDDCMFDDPLYVQLYGARR